MYNSNSPTDEEEEGEDEPSSSTFATSEINYNVNNGVKDDDNNMTNNYTNSIKNDGKDQDEDQNDDDDDDDDDNDNDNDGNNNNNKIKDIKKINSKIVIKKYRRGIKRKRTDSSKTQLLETESKESLIPNSSKSTTTTLGQSIKKKRRLNNITGRKSKRKKGEICNCIGKLESLSVEYNAIVKDNGKADHKRRNLYLSQRVFNGDSTFLYHRDCLMKKLGVSKNKLTRLRKIHIEKTNREILANGCMEQKDMNVIEKATKNVQKDIGGIQKENNIQRDMVIEKDNSKSSAFTEIKRVAENKSFIRQTTIHTKVLAGLIKDKPNKCRVVIQCVKVVRKLPQVY